MTRIIIALVLLLAFTVPTFAEDYAPDDVVMMDLSTEGFVTTQTANVTVMVDAAADDAKAATLRADMQKAVADIAKADWRLTNFNRSQDSTGLSRWNANYEARIAESQLAGINDRAKKASRAGMQITVVGTDFTPTLAETEAKKSELRTELLKRANDELAKLNATGTGRVYRLASISYGNVGAMPMPRPMYMKAMRAEAMTMDAAAPVSADAQVAQRLTLTAQVVFGTRPAK